MSVGERITELRKKQNMSQNQLADAMEVSRQAVSKWENDKSSPDTLNLIRLSEILDTDVEYLATGRLSVPEEPVVREIVKNVDRIVERVIEKPVVHKVFRKKYLRNPVEFFLIGSICFVLGFLLGFAL